MIAALGRRAAERLARGYVAGADLVDAIAVCRKAAAAGWGVILGYWDGPLDTPGSVQARYRHALTRLAREGLDGYVSIKGPALAHGRRRLDELLAQAAPLGLRVHLDAHAPAWADSGLRLVEGALARGRTGLGMTLPARWRRSAADAERLRRVELPLRVVKGQWPDPESPETDSRPRFLEIIDALAGRDAPVAVASHDERLAREALARLKRAGTPCELEQLYGLPHLAARVARPLRISLRLYVPYGVPSLPYDAQGPALLTRVARDAVSGWRG